MFQGLGQKREEGVIFTTGDLSVTFERRNTPCAHTSSTGPRHPRPARRPETGSAAWSERYANPSGYIYDC